MVESQGWEALVFVWVGGVVDPGTILLECGARKSVFARKFEIMIANFKFCSDFSKFAPKSRIML
ncbi:hypothetical protein N782_00780 [Pontibacillus yanchengensis Y32]|uniref:Uncharacterized protein n=1 Tax=Pontibacillus yanchengensis Y32 TaxID=1385514 RepID=A0A0A2TFS8_9BACI|nr:hypothetical protein N782_00780 [Pontibacillus yanchengensis Y32]